MQTFFKQGWVGSAGARFAFDSAKYNYGPQKRILYIYCMIVREI
jgi:hypothetical protein